MKSFTKEELMQILAALNAKTTDDATDFASIRKHLLLTWSVIYNFFIFNFLKKKIKFLLFR
jgi:hypothetical protein